MLISISVNAQFILEAEFRPRMELCHGSRNAYLVNSKPVPMVSQRSRFTASYTTNHYQLRLSPQDVRIWGDESLASSIEVYGNNLNILKINIDILNFQTITQALIQ